jgi:putative transposase
MLGSISYHNRKNTRLPGYDYASPGAYLVTICTKNRVPFFRDEACKRFAEQMWYCLPERFPSIRLDAFAILPDHVHGIIWLEPTDTHKPKLWNVVGAYKSLVYYHYIRSLPEHDRDIKTIWQFSFNDSILRTSDAVERARLYVINNPMKHDLKGTYTSI